VLDELAGGRAPIEVLRTQKVVIHAVRLALARPAGGGGYRQLESRDALEQALDKRSLADPRRAGDDQDRGYRRRKETSSLRCRSDRPPIVLLGEIRQCVRMRLTFTRPYFGTASSRSKTLAVSR
jgi:hypothetical protein